MANEAIIVELDPNAQIVDFTTTDGAAISGGALCILIDPRVASGSIVSSTGDAVAGIAAADKKANDGALNIGMYQKGVFDLKINATETITLGDEVAISGANLIRAATDAEASSGKSFGRALETGAASEVIEVRVNL